jgi:hypothetical protein
VWQGHRQGRSGVAELQMRTGAAMWSHRRKGAACGLPCLFHSQEGVQGSRAAVKQGAEWSSVTSI